MREQASRSFRMTSSAYRNDMRLLVGSFAATMGDLPNNHDVVSGLLPPLAAGDDNLDLEYSLLLAFDALVFDRYSVERLESYTDPGIQRLTRSLRVLEDAGFLILEDFRAKVNENRAFIDRGAALAVADPSLWLPHLKHEFAAYDQLLPRLRKSFGSVLSAWDGHTFGIATYLLAQTGRIEDFSAKEIRQLIENTNRRRRRSSDNALISDVLKPLVENIYANLYLSEEYGCVPYGWGTLSGFYDHALVLAARNVGQETSRIEHCRRFFDVAFREFKPRSVEDWIRLLRDPRIDEIRAQIEGAIRAEVPIDERFAQRALAELQRSEGSLRKYKSWSARIAASASLVAGIAGGILGGLVGLAGSAGPVVVQEVTDALVERRIRKKHAWLYFTSYSGGG